MQDRNVTGGSTLAGIACGAGAGALWGLVFLAPELVRPFNALEQTIGRYVCYGAISALLIAPRWRSLAPLVTRRDWAALAWLALAGNIIYYLLLSSAVRLGGIAMTSLVVGFLPVTVTLIGSRDLGAVPLRKLALSLTLCVAGALCIGWQAATGPVSGSGGMQMIGFFCAVGALLSWTGFAVGNSRCLRRAGNLSSHDWSLLTGIVTGTQSLFLIPFALAISSGPHDPMDWARLGTVSLGVALLASIVGNALWNRMSRLLPLTLAGQMILFETLFALIYGFLWEQRLPAPLEILAFGLLVLGVLSCVAAHRRQPVPEGLAVA